jgi:hypothetical protein
MDVQECIKAGIEPVRDRYESWIGGDLAHARMLSAIETAPAEVDKSLTALGMDKSFAESDLRASMLGADRMEVGRELWWSGD